MNQFDLGWCAGLERAARYVEICCSGPLRGHLAEALRDFAIAKHNAVTWRRKAKEGKHPGRGFCSEQTRNWEKRT
jgi:hypothetical protein